MVLALAACKDESKVAKQAEAKPAVKIGVLAPLSGSYAHFGDAMKTAIKMFEDDKNTQQSSFQYNFFVEDNAFNASRSAVAAKKLIEVDKVDVIITLGSDIGLVVAPIAQKSKVIHLALATDRKIATEGDYNFTVSTPPNKNTGKMIEELQRLNLTQVAFVIQNTAMMQSVADDIRGAGRDGRINILSDNSINSGERDFRILIHKALQDNPNAMIVQLQPPELQIFVKQLREIDRDIVITSVESFLYPEDKTLFEGTWYSGAVVPSRAYLAEFKKLTGLDTTDYSELVYAALKVVRAAYTSADKAEVINNIIALKMDSFSVGGVYFNGDGVMQTNASLYTIKDGKIEPVGE